MLLGVINIYNKFMHVKFEKFKRGRSPSLHFAKEGDFTHNSSAIFTFKFRLKFENNEIILYMVHNIFITVTGGHLTD